MGYGRVRRGRLSPHEHKEQINAAHNYVASLCPDPQRAAEYREKFVKELPPKRDKVFRPYDRKPVGPSEHQEQSAVIKWWALVHQQYRLPEFALFAIPNGGARDPITGARLKAEGVRRGVVDLMLARANDQHAGLFLEMKVGSNKPSNEQVVFMEYLASAGYLASVHWDSASAINAIQDYLKA